MENEKIQKQKNRPVVNAIAMFSKMQNFTLASILRLLVLDQVTTCITSSGMMRHMLSPKAKIWHKINV